MANLKDSVILDSTSTANTLYVGKAKIGSSTSDPVWEILVYDSSGDGQVKYPTDTPLGKSVWTSRTSYTYA